MRSNIAVVGGGYWGKNLIRNFAELGALRTVCDDSPLVEANTLAKYPGLNYCRDYADVLSDENIRGVVLATPAMLHFEMTKRAILAGKDVFVEKPLSY
jgi:UDP-2-acetamido-3-amino-2,3-dideoxy-glucuronate N-acetyltransferase